jgi:hypothetical protein
MSGSEALVREARGLYTSLYASRTASKKQLKRARRVLRRAGTLNAEMRRQA